MVQHKNKAPWNIAKCNVRFHFQAPGINSVLSTRLQLSYICVRMVESLKGVCLNTKQSVWGTQNYILKIKMTGLLKFFSVYGNQSLIKTASTHMLMTFPSVLVTYKHTHIWSEADNLKHILSFRKENALRLCPCFENTHAHACTHTHTHIHKEVHRALEALLWSECF